MCVHVNGRQHNRTRRSFAGVRVYPLTADGQMAGMAAAAGTCRRNGQPLPGLSIRLADLYAPPHLAAMSPSGAASEGHEPAGGPEGPEGAPLPQNGCASDVGEPAGIAAPQADEQAAPPLDGTDAVARPPEQEANALHRRELGVGVVRSCP